jgi:hypothetical protein
MGYVRREILVQKNIGKLIQEFTPPKNAPLKWKELHKKLIRLEYAGRDEMLKELENV